MALFWKGPLGLDHSSAFGVRTKILQVFTQAVHWHETGRDWPSAVCKGITYINKGTILSSSDVTSILNFNVGAFLKPFIDI